MTAQTCEREILTQFADQYQIDVEQWDVRSVGSTLVISGIHRHQDAVMLRDYLRTAKNAATEAVEPVVEDVHWAVIAVGSFAPGS